jgi:Domain of unknown function (DUF3127)
METIKGTLLHLFEVEIKNGFRKRIFVIQENSNPNYPQEIKLEAHKDKCDVLNLFAVGMEVEVNYFLNGKSFVNQEGVKTWNNQLVLSTIKKI